MVVRFEFFFPLWLTLAGIEFFLFARGASSPIMPYQNQTASDACKEDQFQCGPAYCIPSSHLCDAVEDCGSGSDEDPDTCHDTSEVEPQLAGGKLAQQEEYPWHVGLYWIEQKKLGGERHTFRCGGTLVAVATVLTAAHCAYDTQFREWVPASKLAVAAGKSKSAWELDEEGTQKFTVLKFVKHEHYKGREGYYNFDIALIILSNPVRVTLNVVPIRISFSKKRFKGGTIGRIAGWGKSKEGEISSPDLLYAEIPYVQMEKCRSVLGSPERRMALTFDKFCGGYLTPGPQIQLGDSGGGLVYEDNGKHYVIGLTSTALRETKLWVSFFTDIVTHKAWIKREMGAERIKQTPCTEAETRNWAQNVAVFKIRNTKSNKFLSVEGTSTWPGANIIGSEDNGGPDKLWWFKRETGPQLYGLEKYKLKNLRSGLFLTEKGPSGDGTLLQQDYENSTQNSWQLLPSNFKSKSLILAKVKTNDKGDKSGRILSFVSSQVSTSQMKWEDVLGKIRKQGEDESRWSLEPSGTDYDDVCSERRTFSLFKIRNENSGKLLAVDGSSTKERAQIVQWEDTGRPDQLWYLEANTSESWEIRNNHSNMAISHRSFTGPAYQVPRSYQNHRLELTGDGSFLLHILRFDMPINKTFVYQVENESMENGAKLVLSKPNGSKSQRWSFLPVDLAVE